MIKMPAKGLAAIAMLCVLFDIARAADPLPAATQLIAAANAPAPTQLAFTIGAPQDLVVTLTDLQIPGALVSAGIVVTQAGAIAGSAQLAAPSTSATVSLPAASGNFTLYVFGVPNAAFSVGTFTACVAPATNPANCIQSASLAGNITAQSTAKDPTVSTLSTPLTVTTAGTYTFTYMDLAFPAALQTQPSLLLTQGSSVIVPPGQTIASPAISSGTVISLNPGSYQVLSIAQADQTVKAGLYGITISGPAGSAPLLDSTIAVGLETPGATVVNSSSQTITLTVTDYAFPGPLASAGAMLTVGGSVIGSANSTGGAVMLTAPAGTLTLWTYGNAGATAGTYSADLAGATDLLTTAQGVSLPGAGYAFAFVSPVITAGGYQATAADLQFPSQLTGLSFAAAQNGIVLQQSPAGGTVNFNAGAGQVVLLVGAQTASSGGTSSNGLFDVNLQSTGASAALVYDKTQLVGAAPALFDSQALTVGVNANFDASLTDLKFPTQFDSLALVISRGTEVFGKFFGGGLLSFAATPGTYQLTFIATPSAQQQFGLYADSVVFSPPVITFTSNVTAATLGTPIQLTWSASNATTCSASGGSWTGSKATSMTSESVILSATTAYTLTCAGAGGSTTQSVSVTATPAAAKSSGGGGSLDLSILLLAGLLLSKRLWRTPAHPNRAAS